MSSPAKVLWGEGLFLRPQHFQQQDRYHDNRLHDVARSIHPYCWGVRSVKIDKEALLHNKLRVLELSLIFQDGESYNAPDDDIPPDDVDLSDLILTGDCVSFHVCLPMLNSLGGNFSASDDRRSAVRYQQVNRETADLYTQAAHAEISYLKKSARLIADSEPRSSFVHFPLLRVKKTATGGFELDSTFVPPSLSLRSAPTLFLQLRRLMDALQAKVNALQGHHREPSKNVIEFGSGDISSFWLLHIANTAFAALTHYFHHPALHPERLYEQLLSIAGGLMTFSKTYSLADLPPYQHNDPGPCFSKLNAIIRELLETVISTRYFSIPLNELKPSYHHGKIESEKIDDRTSFFLAVSADLPAIELIDIVPLRCKAGAPDDVEKLVVSAMPGVKLVHAPQIPSALPIRPDTHYFSLDNKGPLYQRMLQAQVISLYVPSGIHGLRLELYAVAP